VVAANGAKNVGTNAKTTVIGAAGGLAGSSGPAASSTPADEATPRINPRRTT
jgi:hypothetical protein